MIKCIYTCGAKMVRQLFINLNLWAKIAPPEQEQNMVKKILRKAER